MQKELDKFFKLIAEAKNKKDEPQQNDTEKLLGGKKYSIQVKASELADFFSSLKSEKQKIREQQEKDQEKLQELEDLLFSKPTPKKEIKEEKPIVQNLSGPKRPSAEELNLESIRESVLQANEALLIKEDEPEDLVNQSAGEISSPTIGNDAEEKEEVEINTKDVVEELSKLAKSTGVKTEALETNSLEGLRKEFLRFKDLVNQKMNEIGGGGSTKISEMDDVDITNQQEGYALKYNASTKKYDFGEVASDLSAVDQNIIPDTNNTRELGSSAKRWKKIYLASQTVDLGGAEISSDGTGQINIAATGATLPAGSKAGDNKLAVTGTGGRTGGAVIHNVPFYTRAAGLTTPNAYFEFNGTIDTARPFTDKSTYRLANGSTLAETDELTLFQL